MQQTATKVIQYWVPLIGGDGDHLGIAQETKVCPYWQRVYVQTRIYVRKWDS